MEVVEMLDDTQHLVLMLGYHPAAVGDEREDIPTAPLIALLRIPPRLCKWSQAVSKAS
jgi:hypothetical protein